jgi:putative ABC transport system permease protein
VSSSSPYFVGLAVVLLLLVAVGCSLYGRLHTDREVVIVVVRAVVQLVAVAAVIRVVFATPALAPAYLLAMLAVAASTTSRRLRQRAVLGSYRLSLVAIGAAAAMTLLIVVLARALPPDVHQVVPFAAQIIGGAMTAATLAGIRMADNVHDQWDQVEAWLALGATPRVAVQDLGQHAARTALIPALDQTRNVGLVVLPGAFVGLLLAGASPLDAGKLQLLVLVGLLAAESVAVVLVTRLLGPRLGSRRPIHDDGQPRK